MFDNTYMYSILSILVKGERRMFLFTQIILLNVGIIEKKIELNINYIKILLYVNLLPLWNNKIYK